MTTLQIELTGELETRLSQIARESGQSVKDWVQGILEELMRHQEMLEDLEDIRDAERIMADIKAGREKTITLEELERRLDAQWTTK